MRKLLFILVIGSLASFLSCENEADDLLEARYKKAQYLYDNGEYEPIVELLDEVLSGGHEPSNILARAYYMRAFMHYLDDRLKLAYEDYLLALKSFDAIGNQKMVAATYNYMGNVFYDRELYDQAYYYYDLALNHTEASSPLYKGFFNFGVARSLGQLGKYDESLGVFIKTKEIYERVNHMNGLVKLEMEMGILQSRVGNYDQAIKHFTKVENMADLSSNRESNLWMANNNIGNAHLKSNNLAEAEKYLRKSLTYKSSESQLAITYNDLGKVYNKRGEYKEAWSCFKRSINANDKKIEINELAITNKALKEIYTALDQPDSLLHYTMLINDLAFPLVESKSWLQDEEKKIALLTKYQDYTREKSEEEQYAKTSWLMAFIMTFIFMSGVLSMRLWKIYNYKSPEKAHALIKNSGEMVYLLDLFKKEKEEMKKVMDQKMRA